MRKLRGGDLKFSRGFASHTRKKITASYAGYHLGRVLSPISLISCTVFLMRLVKAFHGSITVIKLTTKVSKMKYHSIYINFTFSLCIQLNEQHISSYKCHFAVR